MSKIRDDRYKVRSEMLAIGGILILIAAIILFSATSDFPIKIVKQQKEEKMFDPLTEQLPEFNTDTHDQMEEK